MKRPSLVSELSLQPQADAVRMGPAGYTDDVVQNPLARNMNVRQHI